MIDYFVTSNIWLSLEDYHNKGLKPEETKKAIEDIRDPFAANINLRCKPMRLNSNWIVSTQAWHKDDIGLVVDMIDLSLATLLREKKADGDIK